jgi:hypothetical protein
MPVATKIKEEEKEDTPNTPVSAQKTDIKKMYRLLSGKHLSAEGDVYYGVSPMNPQGDLIELTDEQAKGFEGRLGPV